MEKAESGKILDIIYRIVESYRRNSIIPVVENPQDLNPDIKTNQEQLYSAIKNIVQNAVESVDKNGKVEIELVSVSKNQLIIDISDNGKGMSQSFIRNRLFQPFDSTKGVAGMGVGVYQSRDFVRSIGGDLKVTSEENVGTRFSIQIPVES